MADIALVERDEVLRRTLAKTLGNAGHSVRETDTVEQARTLLDHDTPDLLISEYPASTAEGTDVMQWVAQTHPAIPVILITEQAMLEQTMEAMRGGAAAYLRKPIERSELSLIVDRCLDNQALRKQLSYYHERELGQTKAAAIIGDSASIRRLRTLIGRLAGLEKRGGIGPTILLAGEAGTGKGLVARAIHNASPRAGAPFVEVNCRAIPDSLLEAELAGYEKGGFSDAATEKPGLIETAEGGTLFFDEVAELGRPLQPRLLKLLDDRVVRRLGSTRDRPVRCTVIAATDVKLEEKVARGEFLGDLLDRLSVVKLEIPPLRDRDNDVVLLGDHLVKLHADEYGVAAPRLSARAVGAIKSYSWPGNVRELSHVLERAIVMNPGAAVIEDDDLALPGEAAPGTRMRVSRIDELEVDFTEGAIRLQDVEVGLIKRAMEFTRGNQVRSARLLGLSRDALRYRLEKYKLR